MRCNALWLKQVALVTWTESVGVTLVHRELTRMRVRTPTGDLSTFIILQIFPFTSETKRMGIIVKVSNYIACKYLEEAYARIQLQLHIWTDITRMLLIEESFFVFFLTTTFTHFVLIRTSKRIGWLKIICAQQLWVPCSVC